MPAVAVEDELRARGSIGHDSCGFPAGRWSEQLMIVAVNAIRAGQRRVAKVCEMIGFAGHVPDDGVAGAGGRERARIRLL